MPNALVANIGERQNAPDATIARLLDEERQLRGEIDDLRRQRTRLGELSTIPCAAEAELAALDAAEREALAAWARTGNGEAPVVSGDARAALEATLASPRQRAAHAVSAIAGIERKWLAINAKIDGIAQKINVAVEANLDAELEQDVAKATLAFAEARKAVATLQGYRAFMGDRGRQLLGENQDAGRAILSRLEKLTFQEIGELQPEAREIDAAVGQWRARAAAARAGR